MDELVKRVAGGDQAAFARLYRGLADAAFQVAYATLRDRAQAEEVTQEVFLEVWRTAAGFEPERSSAGGWIRTIARNRAIDRVRAVESSRSRDHVAMTSHVDSTTMDPEEIVLRRYSRRAVRLAMAQLCHEHRAVLVMAHFENLTQPQISAELGLPLGTVKSRTAAALRELRVLFDANDDPL
jgi:RNA polymerase sigma-70 factor, ECF subfamily